ncbi:hypothetical protein TW86_22865 [Halomonas sp. S2151]|nr:hypothetical protein TW86_22865 [Halomonas sp. S2151]
MSKEKESNRQGRSGAKRQAAYADRQRALGRRQRSFWLTDQEYDAMTQLLEELRQAKGSE